MSDEYLWDPSATPDPELQRLEALLRSVAYREAPLRADVDMSSARRLRIRWALLAAGAMLAVGGFQLARRASVVPWAVTAERGSPVVRGASGTPTVDALTPGGFVETDARSSATLTVGRIGRATLEPGSRLRLIGADGGEHRLALERGTVHASIDAPPRFFVVQTASALAIDLGCVYTLTADERGNGLLTVEEGEVELQLGARRVSVLAGNSATLRHGTGPGLPYPIRASAALRRAVGAYDAGPSAVTLEGVLAAADARSTITLWHLLQQADSAGRERVYERLAALSPPPATATRERIVRAESGALQRWRTELQPTWEVRPPIWRQAWLALTR